MARLREAISAIVILTIALLANGAGLWNELEVGRADQNDYASHYVLAARIVQAVENGENPLDAWSPEWSFGYSQLRTYQIFSHLLVAGTYFATGKMISLPTIFLVYRYLSMALLPLSFFIAVLLLGFEPLVAGAAALLIPLVASRDLYGLEYNSYTWHGHGLFAQSVASHFVLLSLGLCWRALRGRGAIVPAGAFVAMAFLSHFIYGYVAAASVVLMVLAPCPDAPRGRRLIRAVWIGCVALVASAWQLLPLWEDRAILNHSMLEIAWKWDSFGAREVLRLVFTGAVLDYQRLPVLSVLALGGAVLAILSLVRREKNPERTWVLASAVFWILLFFGRPFWGEALVLIGVPKDFQLHRFSAAVQIFLVLLAAIGLGALWREIGGRTHWVAAAVATALLLYPAIVERRRYLEWNYSAAYENLARYQNSAPDMDALAALVHARGGRVGVARTPGDPRVALQYFMDTREVPQVPQSRHSMNLTREIAGDFHPDEITYFDLFNVHTIAVEDENAIVPSFLTPLTTLGGIHVFDAPGKGYFGLVDVAGAWPTTRVTYRDLAHQWMGSPWWEANQYICMYFDEAPAGLPRLATNKPLPEPARPSAPPGTVVRESQHGENYAAEVDVAREGYVLFRMTWHPKWQVYVDGKAEPSLMLTPGFLGARVGVGKHRIECRYEPGAEKIVLSLAGMVMVIVAGAREFRRPRR
jgi:hypothetical protein